VRVTYDVRFVAREAIEIRTVRSAGDGGGGGGLVAFITRLFSVVVGDGGRRRPRGIGFK
jgi:hypothetical protein